MRTRVQDLLRLIALMWLALGMSLPASAWTAHMAAHGAAQIGVDQHHHHGEDGAISVHDHDDGEDADGGHDHMPSILLGAIDMAHAAFALAMPALAKQLYAVPPSRALARHASDGLRRPPRIA